MTHPYALDFQPVIFWLLTMPAVFIIAASAAYLMIQRMMPLLQRYALARPNVRSSHKTPTPQGGGIAVIGAAMIVSATALFIIPDASPASLWPLALVAAAIAGIALVGAVDDIRTINVAPRLLLQLCAVVAVIFAVPAGLHICPLLPWWLERIILVIAGLWFVNLVNFMDGIDWMMAAEIVPVALAIAIIGSLTGLAPAAIIAAVALAGAMAGFAPYNKPVAVLFLGDVGSLPIGLMLGWLLLLLAGQGALIAAIILPLYFLADATVTLFRRLIRRERIWEAHRTHFYQRATDNGYTVAEIVSRVFCVNLALSGFALLSVATDSAIAGIAILAASAALVGWLLFCFSRAR